MINPSIYSSLSKLIFNLKKMNEDKILNLKPSHAKFDGYIYLYTCAGNSILFF